MKVAAALILNALVATVAAEAPAPVPAPVPTPAPTPAPTPSQVQTVRLGQDVNYPPYAFSDEEGNLAGFGYDVAMGANDLCPDINIVVEFALWANCWSSANGGQLGAHVDDGTLDGCMTYTHTAGVRNEFADFSYGILKLNKAAGLLTLLDEDGNPVVDGLDDLSNRTVVDVGGWAPTADGLGIVENKCTGELYSNEYNLVTGDGNDDSMSMLRNGEADAMFVYSDQAYNYQCHENVTATWDCDLWEGFGTEYAYVQTGQFGHAHNGTTLVLAKKGSGIAELVNPCIEAFMKTEEYYDVCVKHDLVDTCYENEFFPASDDVVKEYNRETDEHVTDCADGYCKCPAQGPAAGSGPVTLDPIIAALCVDGGSGADCNTLDSGAARSGLMKIAAWIPLSLILVFF